MNDVARWVVWFDVLSTGTHDSPVEMGITLQLPVDCEPERSATEAMVRIAALGIPVERLIFNRLEGPFIK